MPSVSYISNLSYAGTSDRLPWFLKAKTILAPIISQVTILCFCCCMINNTVGIKMHSQCIISSEDYVFPLFFYCLNRFLFTTLFSYWKQNSSLTSRIKVLCVKGCLPLHALTGSAVLLCAFVYQECVSGACGVCHGVSKGAEAMLTCRLVRWLSLGREVKARPPHFLPFGPIQWSVLYMASLVHRKKESTTHKAHEVQEELSQNVAA